MSNITTLIPASFQGGLPGKTKKELIFITNFPSSFEILYISRTGFSISIKLNLVFLFFDYLGVLGRALNSCMQGLGKKWLIFTPKVLMGNCHCGNCLELRYFSLWNLKKFGFLAYKLCYL